MACVPRWHNEGNNNQNKNNNENDTEKENEKKKKKTHKNHRFWVGFWEMQQNQSATDWTLSTVKTRWFYIKMITTNSSRYSLARGQERADARDFDCDLCAERDMNRRLNDIQQCWMLKLNLIWPLIVYKAFAIKAIVMDVFKNNTPINPHFFAQVMLAFDFVFTKLHTSRF